VHQGGGAAGGRRYLPGYCKGDTGDNEADPAADGNGRVSVQRNLALSGPATSDEGFAIVAAKTDATRQKADEAQANKRLKIDKTRTTLLEAVPVSQAALQAVKDGTDFDKLKVPALKAILLTRGLATDGLKAALVERARGSTPLTLTYMPSVLLLCAPAGDTEMTTDEIAADIAKHLTGGDDSDDDSESDSEDDVL